MCYNIYCIFLVRLCFRVRLVINAAITTVYLSTGLQRHHSNRPLYYCSSIISTLKITSTLKGFAQSSSVLFSSSLKFKCVVTTLCSYCKPNGVGFHHCSNAIPPGLTAAAVLQPKEISHQHPRLQQFGVVMPPMACFCSLLARAHQCLQQRSILKCDLVRWGGGSFT